ncbi:cytochrome c553 [Halospina denitrificans]|uniref:Cytochrome c553 n=1 Tax=Halospina denitrificans TaxID=332522 RepID=A0A4V3EQ34_9GAMM|nr:c-type cytochrome [Halospina denitrificans]TDT40308.1 cytochrome c553 [Halospina denitrificans]
MKKLLTGLVVLMGLTGTVQAADPQAGEELAGGCVACHGEAGAEPTQGEYPKLSGIGENYLYRQLKAIQSGDREIPMMAGQLDGMSDQDLKDIAAYFGQQDMPRGEADPELVDQGESLYRGGDMSKGVAACTACHGPQGKGNEPAGYPRISGQSSGYVAQTLKDYKSGARVHNEQSQIMGGIASRLSDSEIEAVAEYIEGLY